MDNQNKNDTDLYTIDVWRILKALWKRTWLIILCGLLAAAIGFSYASFVVTPQYSSFIKLYVNNSSISLGNTSVSLSDLSASKSLVQTYGDILNSRSTLERVAEKAEVDYTWKQLSSMITYGQSNETEIMLVTVVSDNPYEASNIANTIAEVLPERISEIINGASMEVVDSAIPDLQKISPDITKYTAIGFVLGAFVVCLIIAVIDILDDRLHDDDYITKTYDFPILGKIPDLMYSGSKSYGYDYQYGYKKKGK